MLKIHQGFSFFFFHLISRMAENFPLFSFEHFRYRNSFTFLLSFKYCEIYLHFMEPTTRPLSIKETKIGPSFRITSQLSDSDDLHLNVHSLIHEESDIAEDIASRKLVYVCEGHRVKGGGRGRLKRFCKYCSRFCFRILQISFRFLIELSSI